jgi:hypothetical protein
MPSCDTEAGVAHNSFLLAEAALLEEQVVGVASDEGSVEGVYSADGVPQSNAQRLYSYVMALPVATARR